MRNLYFYLIICFSYGLNSQALYKSNDPGSDWSSSNSSHIKSDISTASSGYSESNSSPAASGGNNAVFYDCTPPSTTYSLTSPSMSTIGKSNIRIGFGQRHTATFTSSVLLEWSSNGSSWNTISSNIVSGGTGAWAVSVFDLAASANNVSSLRFRFSFITSAAATNNCPVGGNFKIDDFWVGANLKLPIQLVSFSVTLLDYPNLHWSAHSLINNGHFVLEHSRDGTEFIELAKIPYSPATNNRTYSYTDFTPFKGINYYILKEVDLNGSITLLSMKSIMVPVKEIKVFPSVFHDKLNIELPEKLTKNYQWHLIDLHGRTIQSGEIHSNKTSYSIDVSMLLHGPYILQIKSDMDIRFFKITKI